MLSILVAEAEVVARVLLISRLPHRNLALLKHIPLLHPFPVALVLL
jgi:hypothetical protein